MLVCQLVRIFQREILRCHSFTQVLLEPRLWNGNGKDSTLFFVVSRLAEFTGKKTTLC